jgi:hypothetical protein
MQWHRQAMSRSGPVAGPGPGQPMAHVTCQPTTATDGTEKPTATQQYKQQNGVSGSAGFSLFIFSTLYELDTQIN